MSRRTRLIVLLAPAAFALAGCDALHRGTVRKTDASLSASGIDDPSFQKPDELQGFFKARRNGAWSSEARDIERSLGAF
jgi:hypothetical protein